MPEELDDALAALRTGHMIVVADSGDRENEGDLVMAAAAITTQQMAFYLRHGSGIVCTPMTGETADGLGLPTMVEVNTDPHGTAFTVSVDECTVGTGISATDRATTVRALGARSVDPARFRRPGHLFPLRARPGGVLERAGHTEATVDLLRMSGLDHTVGVITELVDDEGTPLAGERITEFARVHRLPFVRIDDIVRARRRESRTVLRTGVARMPLDAAEFTAYSYQSISDRVEHLALVRGDLVAAAEGEQGALVRIHSECLTGDVFGSHRCDCGYQLQQSLTLIAAEGAGVVVYLRGQEGRGIGLSPKIQAYALQELGHDTVDANLALGLPADTREYGVAAAILTDLGVRRLRLITNSPQKCLGLDGYDLELVDRVRAPAGVTRENLTYLRTKRDRMGHQLDLADAPAENIAN